jgi:hypothetical protein
MLAIYILYIYLVYIRAESSIKKGESKMELNKIYTLQSIVEERIVEEKRNNKDYKIQVAMIADDDTMIAILVDGNHSFQAAMIDGVEPEIEIVKNEGEKELERYVVAFNDLSNPVNIITGVELW